MTRTHAQKGCVGGMCDSLDLSVVARTPMSSVGNCCTVVVATEVDGSNGRRVVSRDHDNVAVAAAAADCVKLMTSALLRENRVIGAVVTEPPPIVDGLNVVAAVLFPVVSTSVGGAVIIFQLEVA